MPRGNKLLDTLVPDILNGNTKAIKTFISLQRDLVAKEIENILEHVFASQNIAVVEIFIKFIKQLPAEKIVVALLKNEQQKSNKQPALNFSEEVVKLLVENSYDFEFSDTDKSKQAAIIEFEAKNRGAIKLLNQAGMDPFKPQGDEVSVFFMVLDRFVSQQKARSKTSAQSDNLKRILLDLLALRKEQGIGLPRNNAKLNGLLKQIKDEAVQAALKNLQETKSRHAVNGVEHKPILGNKKRKADDLKLSVRLRPEKKPRPGLVPVASKIQQTSPFSPDNISNTGSNLLSPNSNSNTSVSEVEEQEDVKTFASDLFSVFDENGIDVLNIEHDKPISPEELNQMMLGTIFTPKPASTDEIQKLITQINHAEDEKQNFLPAENSLINKTDYSGILAQLSYSRPNTPVSPEFKDNLDANLDNNLHSVINSDVTSSVPFDTFVTVTDNLQVQNIQIANPELEDLISEKFDEIGCHFQ